jgi:hypothetical protein
MENAGQQMESITVQITQGSGSRQLLRQASEPVSLDTTDRFDRALSVALANCLESSHQYCLPSVLAWTVCHLSLSARFENDSIRELTGFVLAARQLAERYEQCSTLTEVCE